MYCLFCVVIFIVCFVLFYILFILCCSMYCLFYDVLCIVCFVLFYVLFVLCCSMYCLFCNVPCIVCVYMCTELLTTGGYPITVKYISYYICESDECEWLSVHIEELTIVNTALSVSWKSRI
jgi:hypothetical protein